MARWDRHGDAVDLSDPIVLGWLAGLLEGEGSFKWKKRPGREAQPQISIQMCDEDVIRRLAAVWNSAVARREPKHSHWSPSWETSIGGRKAFLVMRAVLPIMGERRAAKIREIMEEVAHRYDTKEAPSWQHFSIGSARPMTGQNHEF